MYKDSDAVLLHSYAPHFPAVRFAGQYTWDPVDDGKNPLQQAPEPLWGMVPCGGWFVNYKGVLEGGSDAAHHCWAVGMAADPGHLGYMVTYDDSVVE